MIGCVLLYGLAVFVLFVLMCVFVCELYCCVMCVRFVCVKCCVLYGLFVAVVCVVFVCACSSVCFVRNRLCDVAWCFVCCLFRVSVSFLSC